MKNMKKVFIICISLLMLVGCGCTLLKTPTKKVEELLNMYKMKDKDVMDELDEYVATQDLTDDQKDKYKEIISKQYTDMKYEVTEETIDGEEATVTAKITVYDLYKVQKDAEEYLTDHKSEFYDETDTYDKTLFIDYKLDKMKSATDTVDYTVIFQLNKVDGTWEVDQLDNDTLEKIHGIYNYDND